MHGRTRLLFFVLLLAVGTLGLPWAASPQEPVTGRLKVSIGGFLKPEFVYHSTRVGAAGGSFGLAGGGVSTVVPVPHTFGGDNGAFSATAAGSRLNLTLSAPDWRGIKPLAFFELDFLNTALIGAIGRAGGGFDSSIQSGASRIRHSFLRLAGDGLGGSWDLLVGQTFEPFGVANLGAGSAFSFTTATLASGLQTQVRFTHRFKLLPDLQWENAIAATQAAEIFGEVPDGVIYTRFSYAGWQGFINGARSPLDVGVSAVVGRVKHDIQAGGAVLGGNDAGTRSITNVRWGIAGILNLPILRGRSATDRTWALSANAEAHYGEGIADLVGGEPGAGPTLLGGVARLSTANGGSQLGQAFIHPGKCGITPPPVPGVVAVGAAGGNICPGGGTPSELSLFKVYGVRAQGQLYLPWDLWVVGQWSAEWSSNNDNAFAQTTVGGILITPTLQGQGFEVPRRSSALQTSRDALVKRSWQRNATLFWDMTPNIRWGLEWIVTRNNRRASYLNNQDHRIAFGAFYFF